MKHILRFHNVHAVSLIALVLFPLLILTIGCEKKNGPVAVSVAPDSGSGSSQTFVIKFSHKGGYRQFSDVRLLINAQVAGDNACYVYYSLPTNSFLLVNDAGNGSTSAVLGSGTSVQNSQCNVLTEGANAIGDGSGLSVSIPIRFKTTFAGQKKLILYAETTGGVSTDLVLKGLYEVIH